MLCRLKLEGEELARHGPAKALDQQGIDKYADTPVQKGANYCEDPTGRRSGQGYYQCFDGFDWLPGSCGVANQVLSAAPDPAAAKTLFKTLHDAEQLAHKVHT